MWSRDGATVQDVNHGHGQIFTQLPWPYEANEFPKSLAAIVQIAVGDGRVPARYVLHDADGYWHISDGTASVTVEDMAVDAIWHTIDHNVAVAGLADLPPGWAATDDDADGQWKRFRFPGVASQHPSASSPSCTSSPPENQMSHGQHHVSHVSDQTERPVDHDARWEEVVQAARERAATRQRAMVERYGLAGDVQYQMSMDDARMVWSRGGSPYLTARITMIGSVSIPRQTWLWSWANQSLPPAVLGDIARVRAYGEENDFPVLPWKGFRYHPALVAEARQVSAAVLDAEGLWVEVMDDVQLHFLFHDLTLVSEKSKG
jgi:hypothetical protein